jgi:hypothetical protein
MSFLRSILPPQRTRYPRGRRVGVTVPGTYSLSSYDGLAVRFAQSLAVNRAIGDDSLLEVEDLLLSGGLSPPLRLRGGSDRDPRSRKSPPGQKTKTGAAGGAVTISDSSDDDPPPPPPTCIAR